MPKVSASVSVRGTDLKEMMATAKAQMADLGGDINWKISDISLWSQEDAATKQGLVRMYNCSMTLEATVSE